MDRTSRQQLNADLKRLADGDRSAFQSVFEAAWPVVIRFTTGLLADPGQAEDAAQLALMKVFSRASQFDAERDALSWILTLARFEVMTIRKRATRRREDPADAAPETADLAQSPEHAAIARDLIEAVRGAFEDLSESDVQTIITAITDADRGNVSAGAFRKRWQRALQRLRTVWSERNG